MENLRPLLDCQARSMAEALVDTPANEIFGDIELTLRDRSHQLAAQAHQVALDGDKKRGTSVRVESVPTAKPMPDSSNIEDETS